MTTPARTLHSRLIACVCLLAVLFLYAPLAGAAWTAHVAACCASDHCPIPQHHQHHDRAPVTPSHAMDCGHDEAGMTACKMSCCQNPDRPAISGVAFVMPPVVSLTAPGTVQSAIRVAKQAPFLRSVEPLSPPPRYTAAAI